MLRRNTYGDSRMIILLNSGITVRVSVYYWQDWHPLNTRDATIPKVPAPTTFADCGRKIDPVLGAIIAYRRRPAGKAISRIP